MKGEDFLKAFAEMSPEEQEAIRDGLLVSTTAYIALLSAMMAKIEGGGDPWATCREMTEEMKVNCC